MRVTSIAAAAVMLAFAAPAAAAKPDTNPAPVLNVVATADQKFEPAVIVMHVGKPQTLRLTSSGGVHGIASSDLGIPATMIVPDKPVSVVVTPKKAGTYKLPCTIVCGANHAAMQLTVEVKP
ncbi:MAG TPA: cupredoxin domain-containing protein [Candidatus Elarobacter sp.]|nr:cupredoxin domain-containing protein [Candidatus Elarobacter sp.]